MIKYSKSAIANKKETITCVNPAGTIHVLSSDRMFEESIKNIKL